jgi:hypothetical protein
MNPIYYTVFNLLICKTPKEVENTITNDFIDFLNQNHWLSSDRVIRIYILGADLRYRRICKIINQIYEARVLDENYFMRRFKEEPDVKRILSWS